MPSLGEIFWSLFLIALTLFVTSLFQPSIDNTRDSLKAFLRFLFRRMNEKSLRLQCSRIVNFHKDLNKFYLYAIWNFAIVLVFITLEIVDIGFMVLGNLNSPKVQGADFLNNVTVIIIFLMFFMIVYFIIQVYTNARFLSYYDKYIQVTIDRLVVLSGLPREDIEYVVGIRDKLPPTETKS
jgi:hypothetical protein